MEDWLRSIGLGHHAAAFRENGISFDLLDKLTEQDLKELGLTIGDRKRFLDAVAKLKAPSAAEPAVSLPGERRPLTVMFVDLVGSTPLGERVDAEDLLEINRLYRELCGAAIGRYGGSVARFLGDGILAYFCYPVANENDPERAVRAALEIVQGIGGLVTPAREPLQARIGIATGRVVVSDLAAGGLQEKQGVTGSIPNEAARLQSLARPNGIVVSEQTHARIAPRFLCEPLGSLEVRGFERLLYPARVIGERPTESHPGTLNHRNYLTGFYGREADVEVLRAEWRRVAVRDGRSVLVIGEPGIGKSRLVEQVIMNELPPDANVVRLGASPFSQDTPLAPVAEYARAGASRTHRHTRIGAR